MGPPLGGPCFYMVVGLSAAPDGTPLRVPTLAETLRVKAWLALMRSYGRDHTDTAALTDPRPPWNDWGHVRVRCLDLAMAVTEGLMAEAEAPCPESHSGQGPAF